MKKILIPLAPGFEEIEAVTIIDVLRRAGANVVTAGLTDRDVTGSHNIHFTADSILAEEANGNWDLIVLPGGVPGAPNLAADKRLINLLQYHFNAGRLTAAICAAPFVLDKAGLLPGRKVTIHPDWAKHLEQGKYTGNRVQTDGNIITGMSAGTAMEFAFELVDVLYGPEKASEINQGMAARLN